MDKKKVDIIISCYNEENNILPFFNEAIKHLNNDKYIYNIVYVNDGSKDSTYEKIIDVKCKLNNEIKKDNINLSVISFIHNYGHEAAMCAGIYNSIADYIIILDVDLQNPPSKIPEILSKFENGADCVLLRRSKYLSASLLKQITSKAYYLFSRYVLRNKNYRDVSDFFGIDKNVAKRVVTKYHTTLRFVRSFVQHEAKNIMVVNYESPARYSGETRYNYLILLRLAAISELSRSRMLRDKYRASVENPIYIIDKNKSQYVWKDNAELKDGV